MAEGKEIAGWLPAPAMASQATLTKTLRKAMRDSGESLYRIAVEAGVDYSIVTRWK